MILDDQRLDVQHDVGHVLDDAGQRGELVLRAVQLDLRDRAAFQAGEQNPPQAVADRHAEAALERLGDELAVGRGQVFLVRRSRDWAVPVHAIEFASEASAKNSPARISVRAELWRYLEQRYVI